MDKVIIDKIDVSECKYYDDGTCCNKDVMSLDCENTDCIYKQLKRLQAENFELKESLKVYERPDIKKVLTYYRTSELERLEQENERLKENKGRCAFKSLDNTFCDEARIKIDQLELNRDCLNASLETARKYRGIAETDRDKYKQALQEIRDMVDCANCEYESNDNCNPQQCSKIEAKINEVIGEKE